MNTLNIIDYIQSLNEKVNSEDYIWSRSPRTCLLEALSLAANFDYIGRKGGVSRV